MGNAATIERVELRPVEEADAERIFAWRNLPDLIDLSTRRKSVTWEEHSAWFRRKLDDDGCRIFIILCNGEPAGQLRFERADNGSGDWNVGIYLIDGFKNKGVGSRALKEGCDKMAAAEAVCIVAYIREDNETSRRAFANAGFGDREKTEFCPPDHQEMVWRTA